MDKTNYRIRLPDSESEQYDLGLLLVRSTPYSSTAPAKIAPSHGESGMMHRATLNYLIQVNGICNDIYLRGKGFSTIGYHRDFVTLIGDFRLSAVKIEAYLS